MHLHVRLREDVLDDSLGEVGLLESASGRAVLDVNADCLADGCIASMEGAAWSGPSKVFE